MNKFFLIYEWFVRTILYFLPDSPFIMRFRGWLYSFVMKECGYNFQVAHNVILRSSYTLSVGNNVYIANNCVILGGGNINIEDEVIIGPGCVIASRKHTILNNSFRFGKSINGYITIGKGSWIGANCTIVANSSLPKHSILGANSVLNKFFFTPSALYAGVPAKMKKQLNDKGLK